MKKLILLLSGILSASVLMAQHVSEAEALEKAQTFLQKKVAGASGGQRKAPKKMRKLAKAAENDAFYVFNAENNGGFVIVSGDERTEEILGYSTKGNIDNMPENMRSWLKGYEEQIKAIPANYAKAKVSLPTHPAVAPMITAKWDQGAPYNLQCPTEIPEGETDSQHCLTGCVATAMAQITYYWKWPQDYTTVIPAYHYKQIGGDDEASKGIYKYSLAELPPTKFDWSNMEDYYDGTETDASADAVAELMRYCGQSVLMSYDQNGSGAVLQSVSLKYFGYDSRATYVFSSDYSIKEWDILVYQEISKDRPVWYSGDNSQEGHCFVLDGYDGYGNYHVNWGWSGYCNGFFKLSVLNPYDNSETAAGLYNKSQKAVIGIQPPNNNDEIIGRKLGTLMYNCTNSYLQACFTNNSIYDVDAFIGFGILNDDGNLSVIQSEESHVEAYRINDDGAGFMASSKNIIMYISETELPNGSYKITPIWREPSEPEWHTDSNDYAIG